MTAWAGDGTALALHPAKRIGVDVKAVLQLPALPPTTTAAYWRQQEYYARNRMMDPVTGRIPPHMPMLRRPVAGLAGLLTEYTDSVKEEAQWQKDNKEALEKDEAKLTPGMRAEIKKQLTRLQRTPGFGAWLVTCVASEVYRDSMGAELEEVWVPSPAWAYFFLKKDMGLVLRRVTGSRPTPREMEETNRLHLNNLQRVAECRSEGFQDWQFIMCDEFGQLMWPSSNYMWDVEGAANSQVNVAQDKRQFTCNLAGCGDGSVLAFHCINEGKTKAVHPSVDGKEGFEAWLFDHTENHWCDDPSKKRFMLHCWTRFKLRWMEEKDCDEDTAQREAKAVFFLDCWPVNTTSTFRQWVREHCPGFELRFIPYGRTGDFQCNDTHWHKPIKFSVVTSAHTWYMRLYRKYLGEFDAGRLTEDEMLGRLKRLFSKDVLREQHPLWMQTALTRLERVEHGENLLGKAWRQLYFEPPQVPSEDPPYSMIPRPDDFTDKAIAACTARRVAYQEKARKEARVAAEAAANAAIQAAAVQGLDAALLGAAVAAVAVAAAGQIQAKVDAAGVAALAEADHVPPPEVAVVAGAERDTHDWDIPKFKAKGRVGGKPAVEKRLHRAERAAKLAAGAAAEAAAGGGAAEGGAGGGGGEGGGGPPEGPADEDVPDDAPVRLPVPGPGKQYQAKAIKAFFKARGQSKVLKGLKGKDAVVSAYKAYLAALPALPAPDGRVEGGEEEEEGGEGGGEEEEWGEERGGAACCNYAGSRASAAACQCKCCTDECQKVGGCTSVWAQEQRRDRDGEGRKKQRKGGGVEGEEEGEEEKEGGEGGGEEEKEEEEMGGWFFKSERDTDRMWEDYKTKWTLGQGKSTRADNLLAKVKATISGQNIELSEATNKVSRVGMWREKLALIESAVASALKGDTGALSNSSMKF